MTASEGKALRKASGYGRVAVLRSSVGSKLIRELNDN